MGVNIFDKPIESQYIPLPFKELAAAGDVLRKVSGEAQTQAEGLLGDIAVNAIPGYDTQRRNEIIQGYEDKISQVADIYENDPFEARRQIRKIGADVKKNLTRGELGAIEGSFQNKKAYVSNQKKLMDEGKITPQTFRYNMRQAQRYEGIGQADEFGGYGSFSGREGAGFFDIPKEFNTFVANYKPDVYPDGIIPVNMNGETMFIDARTRERVDDNELRGALSTLLATNPKASAFVTEQALTTGQSIDDIARGYIEPYVAKGSFDKVTRSLKGVPGAGAGSSRTKTPGTILVSDVATIDKTVRREKIGDKIKDISARNNELMNIINKRPSNETEAFQRDRAIEELRNNNRQLKASRNTSRNMEKLGNWDWGKREEEFNKEVKKKPVFERIDFNKMKDAIASNMSYEEYLNTLTPENREEVKRLEPVGDFYRDLEGGTVSASNLYNNLRRKYNDAIETVEEKGLVQNLKSISGDSSTDVNKITKMLQDNLSTSGLNLISASGELINSESISEQINKEGVKTTIKPSLTPINGVPGFVISMKEEGEPAKVIPFIPQSGEFQGPMREISANIRNIANSPQTESGQYRQQLLDYSDMVDGFYMDSGRSGIPTVGVQIEENNLELAPNGTEIQVSTPRGQLQITKVSEDAYRASYVTPNGLINISDVVQGKGKKKYSNLQGIFVNFSRIEQAKAAQANQQ